MPRKTKLWVVPFFSELKPGFLSITPIKIIALFEPSGLAEILKMMNFLLIISNKNSKLFYIELVVLALHAYKLMYLLNCYS